MVRSFRYVALAALVHLTGVSAAHANVVREWNAIAVQTITAAPAQSPFAQARTISVVQLAVFEAVNAITGEYEPYLGTIDAPAGASAEAAAIAAAHGVLKAYVPGQAANLDAFLAASLLDIPDGSAKDDGIAVGEAAAAAMIALRANDGSSPPAFYNPGPADPGLWQPTPGCPTNPATGQPAGAFAHWGQVTPFAIQGVEEFMPDPPPALDSNLYRKDYQEVMTMGRSDSSERPQDRTDVAQFYAVTSPSMLLNSLARQLAEAKGLELSEEARGLAVLNMAVNDALIVSFATKYHYVYWRPYNAIRSDSDGNDKTESDPSYTPLISTPCFPSYPSNHASGTSAGVEALRRLFGAAGHDLTLQNPAVPGMVLHYNALEGVANDVDDARVYGGIHFRFDQVGGNKVGRGVATEVVKNHLRKVN